jgi:hypothetical protein
MKKHLAIYSLIFSSLLFTHYSTAAGVEVTLIDKLDGNLSSYCIDIVGGQNNADPKDGLQAHTCYSYQGQLGSDQAMDAELIKDGYFKITAFDVCLTLAEAKPGSKINLQNCDMNERQSFYHTKQGMIIPTKAPSLCLTVSGDTRLGRNGTSPHQIKDLTLEYCNKDRTANQLWRMRDKDDQQL